MTDTEVIETLARREGWRNVCIISIKPWRVFGIEPLAEADVKGRSTMANYLTSLDAFRPVLEKLSEKEWSDLMGSLWSKAKDSPQRITVGRFLLTLPPATLARAIAEVIKDSNKGGDSK